MAILDLSQRFWGKKVVVYLFFEGAGAGCYFIASLMGILNKNFKPLFRSGTLAGILLVVLGAFFLWLDLGRKGRIFKAARNLAGSWIARGVSVVAGFLLSAILYFMVSTWSTNWTANTTWLKMIWTSLNALLALAVLTYPAMVLKSCKAFRIWDNPMLILLFILLSFLSGESVLLLIGALGQLHQIIHTDLLSLIQFLLALSASLTMGTAAVFGIYLTASAISTESGRTFLISLTQGKFRVLFALFVVVGTVMPLILVSIGLTSRVLGVVQVTALVDGALLLFSSYLLRYLILVSPTRENPVLPGMM